MPESKLPSDSYPKSDASSIQELGSHIVGARVRITNQSGKYLLWLLTILLQTPGGESARTEASAQESPQPVRPLQHSMHRDRLMKSRSQISAQLDAQQTLIGTPSLPM